MARAYSPLVQFAVPTETGIARQTVLGSIRAQALCLCYWRSAFPSSACAFLSPEVSILCTGLHAIANLLGLSQLLLSRCSVCCCPLRRAALWSRVLSCQPTKRARAGVTDVSDAHMQALQSPWGLCLLPTLDNVSCITTLAQRWLGPVASEPEYIRVEVAPPVGLVTSIFVEGLQNLPWTQLALRLTCALVPQTGDRRWAS